MSDILWFEVTWLDVAILTVGVVFLIAIIVVIGQVIKTSISTVNKHTYEEIANELKSDNAKILAELTDMKESLASINKMMKEIG